MHTATISCPISDLGVVLAAGGSSTRFGPINKLLADLAGRPVFLHSLVALLPVCPPGHFVLVVPPAAEAEFRRELDRFLSGVSVKLVHGGQTRAESVRNGLLALPAAATWAAVHDAARPLITAAALIKVLDAALTYDGAITARKVTDTLKEADPEHRIRRTIDRTPLWAVETPQIFRRQELLTALQACLDQNRHPTDDAAAMEFAGYHPFLCEIRNPNPKITSPEDLELAKIILRG